MTPEDVLLADERASLEAFVRDQRRELAPLLDGLTEDEARRRLVPTQTTLLGLVKHAAFVERVWSVVAFDGVSRAELGLPADAEDSWVLSERDTVASVLADHSTACAQAERVHAAYGLDDVAEHNRRGPVTLRWVLLHLVRELARHAGHGDVLREQLLAGRQS